MIYHLPFRDWLELDTKAPAQIDRRGRERAARTAAAATAPLALAGLGLRLA